MWTETVKFQPKLDPKSAQDMENNLNKRFGKVGTKFGGLLKKVLTGSFVAAGLAIANRLLNPIEAAETKMKALIDSSQDATDLADKFNTTPGQIKKLQDVGSSLGIKPEAMNEMLSKYASAIEATKKDIQQNGAPTTEQSAALKNFAQDKDMAESFFKFMRGLRQVGAQGPLTPQEQAQRNLMPKGTTNRDVQHEIEKSIFGDTIPSRLVNKDLGQRVQQIYGPSAQQISDSVDKFNRLGDVLGLSRARDQSKDFVHAANVTSPDIVELMAKREAREQEQLTNKIEAYKNMKEAVEGIDEIKNMLDKLITIVSQLLGAPLTTLSRWFGSGGKSTGAKVDALESGKAPAGARKGDF